jgi:hypothetical protein
MAKRSPARPKNVIVVSDLHIGCQLALCHPDGGRLDNGGTYKPTPAQLALWRMWQEFWGEWVPRVTHDEPYHAVLNGDTLDGRHHGATSQWSQNLADQSRHARLILAPVAEACRARGGKLYMIRGTTAHAGESGEEEERLARDLEAAANTAGQFARWDLWLSVGEGLVHFAHTIGTTNSSAHETSAINAELAAAFTDSGRWGKRPPDIVVRSHRHRCAEIRLPHANGYATSLVTAGWQLKTPFMTRLMHGRTSEPQIGGTLIRRGDEELHTRHRVWAFERPEAE